MKLVGKIDYNSELNVVYTDDGVKRKVGFENAKNFLDDILTGKIDNRYGAEKEYLEKIQSDEDFLERQKYRKGGKTWKLIKIFNDIKYNVFGLIFPSETEQ